MPEALQTLIFSPWMAQIVVLVTGTIIIVLAVLMLRRTLLRYVQESSARYRARKLVSLLGYVAIAIFATLVFSERLGSLTVAFGVAGAGVALALQEVITSIAGWIALTVSQMYKVGDRVQIGGIRGKVIDIALLRTTIMEIGDWVDGDLYNGRIVRVGNSSVIEEPLYNYSGGFPFLWDEIMLPVKYGSDYHEARELIERVADEVSGEYSRAAERAWAPIRKRYVVEAARVTPMVTMSVNQNWIELVLRFVVDFRERRSTKDRLFLRILEEIDKTDGRVSIAAATLNVEKVAPVDVRLTRRRPGAS